MAESTSQAYLGALRWIARITGRTGERSPRAERILLLVSVAAFIGAMAFAWQRLPDAPRSLHVGWITAALLLSFIALLWNAIEFAISGRLIGHPVPPMEAARTSILGSAANMLPLPGAVIVRTRSLHHLGASGATAILATGAVGVAWVSCAGLLAGVLMLADGQRFEALVILGLAIAGLACFGILIRMCGGNVSPGMMTRVLTIETVSVILSGARLFAVGQAADFDVGIVEAVAINLGAIVSHAAGLAPGGLGLREIASGAMAKVAGASGVVGVVLSVLDRVAMYIALSAAAAFLLLTSRTPNGAGHAR